MAEEQLKKTEYGSKPTRRTRSGWKKAQAVFVGALLSLHAETGETSNSTKTINAKLFDGVQNNGSREGF